MSSCCYCCLCRRRPVRKDTNNKMKNDSPKLEVRVATVLVVAIVAAVVVVGCRCAFVSFVRYLMQTNYANRGCTAATQLGLSLEFEVRGKVS